MYVIFVSIIFYFFGNFIAYSSEIMLLCEVKQQFHFKNGNINPNPNPNSIQDFFNIKVINDSNIKSIERITTDASNPDLYSDTACDDSPYHKSWMKHWKERKMGGQGCFSYIKFNDDFYHGFLSTPAFYDAGSWSTLYQITINRRSGDFRKEVFMTTNDNNPLSWRDIYSGTCSLSKQKF